MTVIPQLTTPHIAVIGSGNWGKNLVRNYTHLNAVQLICDSNPDIFEQFGRQYLHVDTCLTLSDILARQDIQGIVIATPAETSRIRIITARHTILLSKIFNDLES
jgi:UDP-2-acetamido-3-amino-2,3-dideoxy-glucuronate N-acetyltransferase